MTSLRRDLIAAIEKTLAEHGVTGWDMGNPAGHIKFRFVFNGVEKLFVSSGSPSDHRTILNAVADLRKQMGVKRVVYKNPERRIKKRRAREIKLETITLGRDPWEVLRGLVIDATDCDDGELT